METFIVRVWTPSPDLANESSAGELHGSIEHIRSRESGQFHTGGHLLEILRGALLSSEPVVKEASDSS
ncbi:MAG: hypothetical protein H0U08_10360 [Actinobacteria bacterium]|nr:hypothetical protein [Actinomycetota bacterium]